MLATTPPISMPALCERPSTSWRPYYRFTKACAPTPRPAGFQPKSSVSRRERIVNRPSLVALVNWILAAAGLGNLAAGTVYMAFGNATVGAAGVAAGLVLLLAATIDRFESLKGLGMEAKTRELRKTIDEADAVVARMKRLAEVTGASLISLHAGTGRMGGATPPRRGYEISRSVREILEGVGASPRAVRDALEPWAEYAALDVTRDILRGYEKLVEPVVQARQEVVGAYPKPINAGDPRYQTAIEEWRAANAYASSLIRGTRLQAPEALAALLRDTVSHAPDFVPAEALQFLKAEVDIWASELDYLGMHLDYRDPSMWIARINKVLHIEIDAAG